MTPLLGTKNTSAPAGNKSGGDGRAARSLLSCALWHGMGRLWRGMGGMGRPEPLSAHRPHRQQGHSGFHETRNTNHGFFSPSVRKGRTTGNPCPDRRARRPVAAFLRVVERHGAAMVRHGRPPSPAPAARPVGFSPATNHATCFSPAPGDPRESNPKPGQRVFYETRDANQGFFSVGAQGPHNQNRRPDTVPTGKSLFSSSPLFTIVRHYSSKN